MKKCKCCGIEFKELGPKQDYCSWECYEQGETEGNIQSKIVDMPIEDTEEYEPYDKVERPMHYTAGSIETIDYIQSITEQLPGFEAVCIANAIKYISRQHLKNGTEDLKKAVWYLNRLIEYKAE
jgi:hypothetical protein